MISVPAAGFTQRATIDPDLDEIHVLSVSNCQKTGFEVDGRFRFVPIIVIRLS